MTTPITHPDPVPARRSRRGRRRRGLALGGSLLAAGLLVGTGITAAQAAARSAPTDAATRFAFHHHGIPPIKHVWLIILENKSYDATFTGLNNNTYLWKTLPAQGTLLTHYYGTGHFSLDNYVSLVSGQGPEVDDQNDCPVYKDMAGSLDTDATSPNFGQYVASGGPYAANDGCVYPADVPTLFNQLNAAHVSWKGYAQDLGNSDGTGQVHDAGGCGGPSLDPTTDPVTNPGSANATDQYVPKHFPFAWFHSIIDDPSNCDSAHIANLFDPSNGLLHDLQHLSTTPDFSWITPNNCSDAHDAVCHGNNLSGGWASPTTPNAPVNYTGGLYAADLFLEHVIPEIEASPAFKENGLIDVTFDEGFPAFTFTSNSFNNSPTDPATAASSIASDSAGENLFGHNVNFEPTGPNTPLGTNAAGDQLYPGPGDNAFVDRDPTIPGIVMGGAGTVPGPRTDTVTGTSSSPTIEDQSIVITDEGRPVTGTNIPAGATVGPVSDTAATATLPNGAGCTNLCAITGSFTLLVGGVATAPTGPVTSITLGADTQATDPLFDLTDATNGGGDTGSVLISRYIVPGSTDAIYYNHYSWLRTMENLFDVADHSPGLDGRGHIGFAAQRGLRAFGRDVFNCPSGFC
jgi:Phosphoesterase family